MCGRKRRRKKKRKRKSLWFIVVDFLIGSLRPEIGGRGNPFNFILILVPVFAMYVNLLIV